MNAAALLLASFVVVFALCFQQLNVERRLIGAAVGTSVVIGLASLVQFRLLPFAPGPLEIAAYLVGSAAGVVAAMKAHPIFMRWREPAAEPAGSLAQTVIYGRVRPFSDLPDQADSRAERAGIEADLALEKSVQEIEANCRSVATAQALWFDVSSADRHAGVARALRYLTLRDAIVAHPKRRELVRIKP